MTSIIDYKLIGNRIKKSRSLKKITQEQLAYDLSFSTFYISKIENGKATPTLETLAIIANYLELDLSFLITGTSKLEADYHINQPSKIISNASNKQLELIIKLAKAVLDE